MILDKLCKRCNSTKPISEFFSDIQRKDNKSPYCKVCHRDIKRLRKIANPEKISAQKHASYIRNIDTKKKYDKLYHATHKEKKNAQSKIWKNSNRDRYNQRCNMLHKRHRVNLEDEYIKTLLMQDTLGISRQDLPQELIEAKRLELLIKRTIKDANKTM
jgi:hypothetical protein